MTQLESEEIAFQEKALWLIRRILSPDEMKAKQGRNELCQLLLPEACELVERWLRGQVGPLKAWLGHDRDHLSPVESEVMSAILEGLFKATDPRNLISYRPERPYRPWALTVVRNSVLNALRRESRWDTEQVPLHQAPALEAGPDTVELVARQEMIELTRRIFKEMPRDTVRILMRKQAGFTFRELAEELGIHEDSVESRYYRGKRDFERRFREQWQELGSTITEMGGKHDAF